MVATAWPIVARSAAISRKEDGEMDVRTTELIAIGAACGANCIPCLHFHMKKAREAGAEDEQVRAAIRVGQMVRKGAPSQWDEEVEALLGPMAGL
jgi:4-carboxymuconolactone decarboxylase